MRGVMRYRPESVVAILDSSGRGRREDGRPDRRRPSRRRSRYAPTTALVGVATQGGRFPPAWRELLRQLRRARASTSRTACTSSSPTTPSSSRARRPRTASSSATCAGRPPASTARPARTCAVAATDRAHRRLGLRDREDDRRRSSSTARRGGAGSAPSSSRPGQTGIAIAGWGISVDAVVADFIAGAAERLVVEGARARRRAALGRGAGLAPPSGLLGRHARPAPRQRAARCSCSATRSGRPRSRGCPRPHPMPVARRARRAARADRAARPAGEGRGIALNTRHLDEAAARLAIAAAEAETGLAGRRSGALRRRQARRRGARTGSLSRTPQPPMVRVAR